MASHMPAPCVVAPAAGRQRQHASAFWLLLSACLAATTLQAEGAVSPSLRSTGAQEGQLAWARCPRGQIIGAIVQPIYGSAARRCNFTASYSIVASLCLRRVACNVPAVDRRFGPDRCPAVPKSLTFKYRCVARPRAPRPHPPPPKRRPPPPRPRPRPRPPAALGPFTWQDMNGAQKRRAEELLSVFENSSLQPSYGYAQNLHDGRGITFGRSGFCTGTGDGILVVQLYAQLRPQGNPLAKFLPALERIDRQGGGSDVTGLDGFIQAVQAAGRNDPSFRQAQDRLADKLYFAPSQQLAKSLGIRLALSKAQLYDAYIQHGYSDPGYDVYDISANGMADWVTRSMGGSPLKGVDEKAWLLAYLRRRRWVLSNTDRTWAASVARVDVYAWIFQLAGFALDKPILLAWDPCRPQRERGPCQPQPRPAVLSIGGVIYGDFLVD